MSASGWTIANPGHANGSLADRGSTTGERIGIGPKSSRVVLRGVEAIQSDRLIANQGSTAIDPSRTRAPRVHVALGASHEEAASLI